MVLSVLRLLITPLVSFRHGAVCPSSSDYPFGIFWPWCCLSFVFWLPLCYLLAMVLSLLRLLITPLVSFGHGAVCPSSSDYTFGVSWPWCCLSFVFWLHLWYLLAMVLSVLRLLITPLVSFGHGAVCPSSSDYPFGIFWPWCCLSFVFWLPLWYLLAMVLSVLRLLITPLVSFGHGAVCPSSSDYPFGIFWPWCCLSFVFWLPIWYLLAMVLTVLRLLIIPLVSFGHGVVCPSSSDYPFGIFWPWCCLSFVFWLPIWYLLAVVLSVLRLLIIPLVSFGHGAVCPSSSDYPFGIFWLWCRLSFGFWLPLWYLLAMVPSVLRLLITPLVSFGHGAVCPSSSDYPFGIFWPWCCLSFVFWLPLWYLLAMVLSVLRLLITPLVSFGHGAVCPSSSDYTFGVSWPWCCLSFVFWLHLWYLLAMVLSVLRLLITPLVSFGHGVVCPSSSDYPFGIFRPWCCLSFGFWLPLWYLLAMVLSVLRLLITPLVSFGHGAVCPSSSDYPFGIFWPWCCLSFGFWLHLWYLLAMVLSVLRLLITPLVSFGHGAVCPSSSDYTFGIFWPWCCLSLVFWLPLWYLLAMVLSVLHLLITPLVSFGHGVVCPLFSDYPFGIFWPWCSLSFVFWLPLGIFWPWCCLSFVFWLHLWYLLAMVLSVFRLLITPLVSFGHGAVCP